MSSLFGLIARPGPTAYAASRYAVRGFSDALRHELEGTGIGVSTVHPRGVATSIARKARRPEGVNSAEIEAEERRLERLLRLPPERAAEIIVTGIERRRARIIVGPDARVASFIERLLPVSYWSVLRKGAS
jgi:short-subunit dehydrogenase